MKNLIVITGQVTGNFELKIQISNIYVEKVDILNNGQKIVMSFTDEEEAEKALTYAATVICENWKEGNFNKDTMTLYYHSSKAQLEFTKIK